MSILVRLVAALLFLSLKLFPPAYRREFGEERAHVLRLALAEHATRGWPPLLRFCARELRDLPAALWRAHWHEWRQKMNISPPLAEKPLAGWHLLWFVIPFLAIVLIPLGGLLADALWIPSVPLLVLIVVLAVAGFSKGMPTWALPSVGLAIAVGNLLIFGQLMSALPILGPLKGALWTDFMPARVLYALIAAAVFLLPTLLLLLLLLLLANILPALRPFNNLLRQEWTVLPFLLYTANLITPFLADAYRGLELYQLLFVLLLAGGTWLYLMASRPAGRMAILLLTTLLAGAVLALGIYLVYPDQAWANGGGGFPRWWETLVPLLEAAIRLVALCLLALFGAAYQRRTQPLATDDTYMEA